MVTYADMFHKKISEEQFHKRKEQFHKIFCGKEQFQIKIRGKELFRYDES